VGLRLWPRRKRKTEKKTATADDDDTALTNVVHFPQTRADLVLLKTRAGSVLVEYGRATCRFSISGLKTLAKLAQKRSDATFVFADLTLVGAEPGLRGVPTYAFYHSGQERGERVVGTGGLRARLSALLASQ
jgi:hypothetical protein